MRFQAFAPTSGDKPASASIGGEPLTADKNLLLFPSLSGGGEMVRIGE